MFADIIAEPDNAFIGDSYAGERLLWIEKRGLESVLLEAPDEQIHLENCPLDYYTYESFSQRVQDYTEVITALSKEYDEIILLGGSEGATIVGLLRQRSLPITVAIALNGGGQYFFDDICGVSHKQYQILRNQFFWLRSRILSR